MTRGERGHEIAGAKPDLAKARNMAERDASQAAADTAAGYVDAFKGIWPRTQLQSPGSSAIIRIT